VDARKDPVGAKRITAWLPDEPMLYDKLDPMEYLEFVAGLWGVEPSIAQSRARDLLDVLELWPHRHSRCESFSRGMKQKVCLAGASAHSTRADGPHRHSHHTYSRSGGTPVNAHRHHPQRRPLR